MSFSWQLLQDAYNGCCIYYVTLALLLLTFPTQPLRLSPLGPPIRCIFYASQKYPKRENTDIHRKGPSIARRIVCLEYLRAVDRANICARRDTIAQELEDGLCRGYDNTHNAIARERSSESLQTRDIHAMLSG